MTTRLAHIGLFPLAHLELAHFCHQLLVFLFEDFAFLVEGFCA
ncbi:unnamed protein product [Haemonchus placei]|uniref:Uncharacterized protein n=1 Tax=Haemonchus placei TaxID=6290 RepID=A0A3P8CM28_HAEPC|nr:unnamed protein product [Haemonchus placei]